MKRLCFVCLLIMMLSVFEGALAWKYDVWECSPDSDGICIEKYLGSDQDVIIPSEIGGQKIIGIGYGAFQNHSSLTSIVIPEGVTSIGGYAFSGCSSLASIEIPENVTSIGSSAFSGSHSLTSIVIPGSVTSIGKSAFFGCSSLTSIEIPEGVTSIETSAFNGCDSLTSVEIPERLTSIGDSAFRGCSSLTSIKIPEGMTSIGNGAFSGCSSLTSIEIPEAVTSIGTGAFSDCSGLMSIEIPGSVMSIGSRVFSNCSKLTSVEIHEGVTSIGDAAFRDCSSLTSIVIPEGLSRIGNDAFYNCSSLTEVDLPYEISIVDSGAFSGFYQAKLYCGIGSKTACALSKVGYSFRDKGYKKLSLRYEFEQDKIIGFKVQNVDGDIIEAKIPEGVTSIGGHAFSGCGTLTSIEIPESVTSIGDNAFSYCSSLASIKIPKSVTRIGNSAFSNCSSLANIEIPKSVTSIRSRTFLNCNSLTNVEIPDSVMSIGESVFKNCSSLISIEIPEGTTYIGRYAFCSCSSLPNIVIPEGVTRIDDGTFQDCSSLKSVDMPNGITTVGSGAFFGCNDAKLYCSIGSKTAYAISKAGDSFNDKRYENLNLAYRMDGETAQDLAVVDSDEGIENAVVPEFVTVIAEGSLMEKNNLRTVTIKEGVRSIESYALRSSALEKVFFPRSVREFGISPIQKTTTVYCYEYSYAESWARDNGYTVVLVDEKPFSEIGSIDVRNKIYVANGVNTRVKADIFPLLPEITVEWTSSDPEIFTVKDGVITGRKNGTATLTITAGDLSAKSEVIVVTAAEDFTLEDIYVPAKGTAEAIVTGIVPSDATLDMEWSTEDSVIASVTEEGLVTGKVLGDTTLTAVDRVTGRKRTATVYIIGPIKRVELDRSSAELLPFEGLQLNATAYTDERSFMNQQLTFASDNEAVAVVNQRGFVQAKGAGTATITATASKKVKASCQITVRETAIMLIPASATEIADGAFEGTGAELYVIPETTKTIGARAFADMKKARVIVLPEGVEADPTAFDGTDATFIRPDGTAVQ